MLYLNEDPGYYFRGTWAQWLVFLSENPSLVTQSGAEAFFTDGVGGGSVGALAYWDGTVWRGAESGAGNGTRSSFDESVAGRKLVREYVFGSSAVVSGDQIAIRNLTDLAAHFNPFQSFTNQTGINSEIQRYQPFNSTNHEILSDRLNLRSALVGGSWSVNVRQVSSNGVNLNATATAIADVGLADTSSVQVGQLVACEFSGLYVISAIVANTSITLSAQGGSTTTKQFNNLIAFLPIYSAVLSTPHVGGTDQLVFSSLPAGVAVGMQVGYVSGTSTFTRTQDLTVLSIVGNTVTLSANTTWGNLTGVRVVFMPLVTSGQIWSKLQLDISQPNRFFAVETDCELMLGSARAVETNGIVTKTAFDALSTEVPWGAWPAIWAYSGDDGLPWSRDSSEIDMLEMWWSATNGHRQILGNNLGQGIIRNLFFKSITGKWGTFSGFNIKSASNGTGTLSGPQLIQFTYNGQVTHRFVNGEQIKADLYEWTSQAPAQIGLNLVAGTIAPSYSANLSFPMNVANFPNQCLGIKRLRVWHTA